jgi:hypothetical protein
MAVTPGGNFYIQSSDLVANYPATSLAIANRLDKYALNPYTDATERDFLIQFPVQGQIAQTLDDNIAWKYDGTAWNSLSGAVLQVVNSVYSTGGTSTTNTFVDTGLTATITPSSATSQILVFVALNGVGKATTDTCVNTQLLRGATVLALTSYFAAYSQSTQQTGVGGIPVTYLDSPATTLATTYKMQYMSWGNSARATVQETGATSTMTLMEVAA